MSQFFGDAQRALQDKFDTRRIADLVETGFVADEVSEMDQAFIESRDMFWLSTIDKNGAPTVSYKGGDPGFVKVIDSKTIAFPSYNGNGMFYSMGNIAQSARIGMLFIDFERPRRLRMHGHATVSADDPLIGDYPGAGLIVRVALENIFTNCGRYIHKYERIGTSEYVPGEKTEPPVPDWKRVDYLQEALPEKDREAARKAGDVMTEAEYRKDFWKGLE